MDLTPTPLGIDIQANSDTSRANSYPVVAALADGDFVVMWYKSDGIGGAGQGLYGQRFDASGAPVGSEFHVNSGMRDTGNLPSITGLADGGFVATWGDWTFWNYMDVIGQRFDAAGAKVGGQFTVNTHTPGNQLNMDVTALPDGGFLVSWFSYGWAIYSSEDTSTQDGSDAGVFAQRYDVNGVKVGPEFQVNTHTRGHQNLNSATAFADGSFVIVWVGGDNQDGSGDGIFGQRYDAAGARVGGEFQINTFTDQRQMYPDVKALADGGFVVAWASEIPGNLLDIRAQVYAADGAPVGGEFVVNTYVSADQCYAEIAALADGGFVISWASNGQDGSSWGTYGQRFQPDGSAVGSEFLINATTSGTQQGSNVYNNSPLAVLADGTLVQAWEGNDYTKIYFRLIAAPVPVPEITSDGGGDTAAITVDENEAVVTTVVATDATPWETVTYSISGGADGALFAIDTATGALTFVSAPDFESPADAGADNVYDVEVMASDGHGGTDTQAIAVTVSDVASVNIIGASGGQILPGGNDDDTIIGGNGPDSITGARGDDLLAGQRGNDTIWGGEGDDTISGNVGRDALFGDDGNDVINGNSENDTLKGGAGDDSLYGGSEDDMLYGDDGNDLLSGGTGFDTANYRQYTTPLLVTGDHAPGAGTIDDGVYIDTYQGIELLILGSGDDTVNGGIYDERVEAGRGDDVLNGGGGNDTFIVRFGDGADYIDGGIGSDTILAGGNSASVDWTRVVNVELVDGATYSNFVVRGTAAGEALDFTGVALVNVARIESGEGDDTVTGSAGGDSIVGGNGADALSGMAGADTIEGGAGADTLTGGDGNDTFHYRSASNSGRLAPDHIADFTTGDVIDLAGIDADAATAGNQAFTFIGSDPFTSVAGQLRAETVGGVTTISADTNGDGRADLVIVLDNGHLVASDGSDFLL